MITLGDSFIGKTTIIQRIKDGKFNETVQATIYLDHFCIERKYEKKNLIINLLFKDTAGQEKYQEQPIQYIRDSHIVLLVFCDIKTLNTIRDRWYHFYKEKENIENSRFILIGNKSDIFGNNREEIIKEGIKFGEEIDAHLITCSAKSSDNMDNVDRYITTEAKRYIDDEEKYNKAQDDKSFSIGHMSKKEKKEKKGCC